MHMGARRIFQLSIDYSAQDKVSCAKDKDKEGDQKENEKRLIVGGLLVLHI
jgi:hypothetical protein